MSTSSARFYVKDPLGGCVRAPSFFAAHLVSCKVGVVSWMIARPVSLLLLLADEHIYRNPLKHT